jgi:hypothetical protein
MMKSEDHDEGYNNRDDDDDGDDVGDMMDGSGMREIEVRSPLAYGEKTQDMKDSKPP